MCGRATAHIGLGHPTRLVHMPDSEIATTENFRRPLPTAAIVALAVFALAGCASLVAAALNLRADRGAAVPERPTLAATHRPVTPVPTFIPSETPLPTETPTLNATPTESPSPTSTSPPASATPTRAPTKVRIQAGASSAPTSVPRTATPVPTQTAAPPATGGGSHGVTGRLSLCTPKSSYAAKSDAFEGERICVYESITNTTDQAITYGVLGVRAGNISGDEGAFQTSWRGDLSVPAHGNGPTGGGWQDGLYLAAGAYSLTLSICYSNVDTCLGSGGEWETLTPGIAINVVPWTPG